jgi:AraC family transcriptional regulator
MLVGNDKPPAALQTPDEQGGLSAFSGTALSAHTLGRWGTIGRMVEPEHQYRHELTHCRHVFVLWEAEAHPGAADFIVNGRRFIRQGKARGSVDFRPAGSEFIANVHQSSQSQKLVLTLDEVALAAASSAFTPFSGLVPIMTERNPFLMSLIRHIDQLAQSSELNSLHMEALALTCLHEARNLGMKGASHPSPTAAKCGLSPLQVRRLTAYIDDHLGTDVHLIDLANLVGLSPYYFSRSFTMAFGVAPYHYVLKRRIERAKELMLQRHSNLLDIAITVGFAGSSQFSRAFRKITGATPSQWRGTALEAAGPLRDT